MKNSIIYSAVILLLLLAGCGVDSEILFSEPQPENAKDISKFPKRLQGSFISLDDSSMLMINDSLINRIVNLNFKVHRAEYDSLAKLYESDNATFMNMAKVVKQTEDSVDVQINYTDIVFLLDNKNDPNKENTYSSVANGQVVLRKLKGHYFINDYDSVKNGWHVKLIDLKKDKLSLIKLTSLEQIKNLTQVEENENSTDPTQNVTITKKEWRNYLTNNGLNGVENFVRIN